MAVHRDAVLATVTAGDGHRASASRPGPAAAARALLAEGLGPTRWLLAVIDFGTDPARIVTTYGNRKDPPGWTP